MIGNLASSAINDHFSISCIFFGNLTKSYPGVLFLEGRGSNPPVWYCWLVHLTSHKSRGGYTTKMCRQHEKTMRPNLMSRTISTESCMFMSVDRWLTTYHDLVPTASYRGPQIFSTLPRKTENSTGLIDLSDISIRLHNLLLTFSFRNRKVHMRSINN